MTVLIAGCGDLGTEAGLRFAARGHRVVGWRRSAERLPRPIEGVAADLTGTLPAVPPDTTVVVIATAAGERTEAAYRAAYVEGTANVLNALERDGVKPSRILFVSSTAVYGDADGGFVTEDTPADPASPTGRMVLEAEQLLLGRSAAGMVLRLSGIYGPGRTRLIDQLTRGTAVRPAEPQWTNRIHRDDAAAAIVHLTTAVGQPAPVYLGSDVLPVDLGEVLQFLALELGLPEPPTGETVTTRGGDKRCDSALLRSTGFDFTFPTYREGYRSVLAGRGVRHG
ncbi:SDR family oxidoreductase [Arthrobacter sp. Br18]|uniref:SDR family oxidoreductase n=1 Tax=Arthrobacter sp. Br18 TaxID=1312954 RepID=UPI00047873B4|nr:SDR family oxidoreductase [Arthrobacter sp. Br18]